MSRGKRRFRYFRTKERPPQTRSRFVLLDHFSVTDIHKWLAIKDQFLKYYWDYHNNLAYQRSKIADKIKESLLEAAQKPFTFEKWQRAVKYKYANEPLSVAGSLVDPGGRFNIGDINLSQFPSFPAFYIAFNKDTAIQELLSQKIDPSQQDLKLDPLDFALTRHDSIAIVSLSGSIYSVINLKDQKSLQPFVDLIKDFIVSDSLREAARTIGEQEPELVRTVPKLIEVLSDPKWRLWPMQFDVPAPPQIFGQMVSEAGIEGILYTSKFTGNDCLAIFPQNFEEGSFIQLDDEAPQGIKICRLDSKSWNEMHNLNP